MSKDAPIITFPSNKDKYLRFPSWRWDRVQALVSRMPTPGRCSRHDDEFVKAARAFALQQKNAEDDAARANLWFRTPDLYYAFEFWQYLADEPEASMCMQARLLAGQSFETIAGAMGITPGTVKWYEALFFNVADRLNDRDWISRQVLIPALLQAPSNGTNARFQDNEVLKPILDGLLAMLAFFGGRYIVDVLLTGCLPDTPVMSVTTRDKRSDRQRASTIRQRSLQAAVQFGMNQSSVTELFEVYAKIMKAVRAGDVGEKVQVMMLKTLLDQIPFVKGDGGGKPPAEMVLPLFDAASAELCDDEIVQIAAGRPAAALVEEGRKRSPELRETRATAVYADAIN